MTITRSFGPIRVERARHLMRDGERESPPVAPWQTLPPIRLRWILQRPRCLSENSWASLVRDSFGSLSCYRSSGSILSTWFFFLYFFFLQSNGWRSFLEFSLSRPSLAHPFDMHDPEKVHTLVLSGNNFVALPKSICLSSLFSFSSV